MSVIGLEALMAQLQDIADLDKESALLAGGQPIFDEMQRLTPVDTGALLESEKMEIDGDAVSIYAGTDHALPVEFGTIHQPAQSYMRAAIDTKSDEAVKAMAENIEAQIKAKVA